MGLEAWSGLPTRLKFELILGALELTSLTVTSNRERLAYLIRERRPHASDREIELLIETTMSILTLLTFDTEGLLNSE